MRLTAYRRPVVRAAARLIRLISLCGVLTAVSVVPGSRLAADEADEADDAQTKRDVEAFEAAYSLSDDDVLARMVPPFMPERLVYYRAQHAGQAQAIPSGPDTMFFRWTNNKLQSWGMTFSNGKGIDVRTMLRMFAGIYPQEIEGDRQLLDLQISGDFVLRADEPRAEVVEAIEAILRDEPKFPARLRLRDVKRQVYVLRGDYKFTPLPDYADSVQIYGEKLVPNSGAGGGAGDIDEFAKWVGMWIGHPVVCEVDNAPAGISWRYHMPSPSTQQERAAAKDPRSVLQNLQGQTGLAFAEEEIELPMLFVERDE
jgi:hypothetical protein